MLIPPKSFFAKAMTIKKRFCSDIRVKFKMKRRERVVKKNEIILLTVDKFGVICIFLPQSTQQR